LGQRQFQEAIIGHIFAKCFVRKNIQHPFGHNYKTSNCCNCAPCQTYANVIHFNKALLTFVVL
jgi:hypothetical protein